MIAASYLSTCCVSFCNTTHTLVWDFGDGTTASSLSPSHVYTDNGLYSVTLSVTDDDGGVGSDTLSVTVNNVAPTITALNGDTAASEGAVANFSATATDPGNDTLIYSWNFGDGTALVAGQSVNHIFADDGAYSVTLVVNDEDGGTTSARLNVSVSNVVPTVATVSGDTNVNEGAVAQYTATATDAGSDTLTYTWNFGDGSDAVVGQSVNHVFADSDLYTTTLTLTDGDGGTASRSLSVNVNNVAPVVEAGVDQTVAEGQVVAFSGSFSDPGVLDTHTLLWDFGDGTTAADLLPTHTYRDNGLYTVTLSVQDDDGGRTSDTLSVTVNNVSPTITGLTGDTRINEGNTASFTATATDPGNDILTYTWNFGDGSAGVPGQVVNHTFIDNGIYSVILTVSDEDSGSTTQTLSISVNNVAPVVDAGSEQIVPEGQAITFAGRFSDPGVLDTHTLVWDFGDGTTLRDSLSSTHLYASDGAYTATLSVTDNAGATTSDTLSVIVNNLPPTITTLSGETTVSEGAIARFSATATDPGNDALSYSWNFGDGSKAVTGQAVNHSYADNGSYAVTLSVSDPDGGSTTRNLGVNVNNVAPLVEAGADQTVDEGQAVRFSGRFTDPGTSDTHTILWDFGDGTTAADLLPTHTYASSGTYTVTLTVTDDDGASRRDALTVTVKNPLSLSVSDRTLTEGNDGTTYAVFTVALSQASTQAVSVNYATANSTATAGVDYLARNGTLTFAPGQRTLSVAVAIIGDRLSERNESFFLNLSSAMNAAISDTQGIAAILDNDGSEDDDDDEDEDNDDGDDDEDDEDD